MVWVGGGIFVGCWNLGMWVFRGLGVMGLYVLFCFSFFFLRCGMEI